MNKDNMIVGKIEFNQYPTPPYQVGDIIPVLKVFDEETSKTICREVFEFFEKHSDIEDKYYANSEMVAQNDNAQVDAIELACNLCDIVARRMCEINR